MAKYGVTYGTLVYVDLDKRIIVVHDAYGVEWKYKLPENVELNEEWIIEHLSEGIKVIYKEEEDMRIAMRIEET